MSDTNARIEAFYAEPGHWMQEALALRAILRETPLAEDFKWSKPCYTLEGANIAAVWRMKEACTLSFFNGVLLDDEAGLLVAAGENSRFMRMIRFVSVGEIERRRNVLLAYIAAAIDNEKSGRKADIPKAEIHRPAELLAVLASDPALEQAFEALTPGRQRGYCLHFAQAKNAATRLSRIERSRSAILAGKGMHDR
ncbi:YdeI/OmpD-associated family protein [Martelella sp. HB161492]|uniref:YdeI/OmpD-associated family protein n=1 Tax=Martelella sp. HB161492 TaxID=2720726 RepID=UPI001591E414|nr:YdeI/OmpD-associated family protein [Martelella sp. HB161492]